MKGHHVLRVLIASRFIREPFLSEDVSKREDVEEVEGE
jgi:hypothetical protein